MVRGEYPPIVLVPNYPPRAATSTKLPRTAGGRKAGPVRKEAYGSERPEVESTILVTPRLALPAQLIEIKFVAKGAGPA